MPGMLTNQASKFVGGGREKWYRAGGAPLPVAAYCPKGAASLAASYINLAGNAAYNAAPGVAPTFDGATGWTFDGAAQWLNSGVALGATGTIIVRFSGAAAIDRFMLGSVDFVTNATTQIMPNRASNVVRFEFNQRSVSPAPGLAAGVLAVSATTAYRNGAVNGTLSGTAATTARPIYIGCRNTSDLGAAGFWPGNIQAVAIYNSTLSGAQVAAVSLSMSQL